MRLDKRALKIYWKLYWRSIKKEPHVGVITFMFFFTFSLSSFMGYDAWRNHDKYASSTFTKWNKFQNNYIQRSIANTGQVCQGRDIQLNIIDSEISELEKQYETGHVIEGNWYGVDLKTLPSIQAQMLADYGNLIGDQNKSSLFKECSEVVCIFNKIYQDPTELSGKITYYWYLKTGSMISLSNELPAQESDYPGIYNKRTHNLQDYLFNLEELKNLYVLAKSLPINFLHNPLFKSIHKVPNNNNIEGHSSDKCAISRPEGQILINNKCIGNNQNFLINITNQIAKYIDQFEGNKKDGDIFSYSKEWLEISYWVREGFFDPYKKQYQYRWLNQLNPDSNVSREASISPGQQFSQLLSYYRFNPMHFTTKTPSEIATVIKNDFYANQTYDPNGMFNDYFQQSVKEWSEKEVVLWRDCMDEHLTPETMTQHTRDLASAIESPLYACVESKIPNFIDEVVKTIKKNNFEGCRFFNDQNQYGHVSEKYYSVLQKFLMEKVLQRKIELQNHGVEVLVGQKIKDEFIKNVDPTSVFINCFSNEEQKECYEQTMQSELFKIMNKHRSISDYYRDIVRKDIEQLFSYDEIKLKTNQIAKKFITPFYSKLHFGAKHIWNKCKQLGSNENDQIKLPMQFTGGKYYVNPTLLNCVNKRMESELYEIVNIGAFQELDEKTIDFKLNSEEKEFALSFMRGKLIQILNNILEEEVKVEENMLISRLKRKEQFINDHFDETGSLLVNIYSYDQVTDKCLSEVREFYPEHVYYSPLSTVDEKHGRTICSAYLKRPKVSSKINSIFTTRWSENKELVEEFIDDYFVNAVGDCNDDFPVEMGANYMRNARMRKICIEESYKEAMSYALEEWQKHEHHEYFASKEDELIKHMWSMMKPKISKYTK